jgi:hypothetical protein
MWKGMKKGMKPHRATRERFLRRERDLLVLAVVEFGDVPAIIVTVFSAIPERR